MNSAQPDTCVFATTSCDHPIHLWDAFSGKVRAHYSGYDAMDELTFALSLSFNLSGEKLYAGYNKMVRVFSVDFPGRTCEEFSTVPIKGHKKHDRFVPSELSLNGVISSISCNPDYSGLVACGSFNELIGIYDDSNSEFKPILILEGHVGGVTQVLWSKCGNFLFSGGRRDNFIHCWDIRNTSRTIFKMARNCITNQKMFFDVHPSGQWLISGTQDGDSVVYELSTYGKLIHQQHMHQGSLNGIHIHPTLPYIVSSSGQRIFSDNISSNISDEFFDEDDEPFIPDNSVCVWHTNFSSSSLSE